MRVQGLGIRVQGLEFSVQGLGFSINSRVSDKYCPVVTLVIGHALNPLSNMAKSGLEVPAAMRL